LVTNNIIFSTIKLKKIPISIFAGTILGAFIFIYTDFTPKWIISCTVGLIILFIAMYLKNKKHLFLALFALALPINIINYPGKLYSNHIGGPPGFYYTFLDFPLLMLYIIWIPKIFISKVSKLHFSRFDISILGVILLSFLSIYNASNPKLCIYSIVQLIIIYLIFFYFGNAIETESEVKYVIIFILVGVFLESILGLFQYISGTALGLDFLGGRKNQLFFQSLRGPLSRVSGTLGHPNDLARYLIIFNPLFISLFFMPALKKIYRILCVALFLLSLSTLAFTLSRSGWGSFLIAMFIFFILGIKAKFFSLRKAIISMLFIGIIIYAFHGLIYSRLTSNDYGSARARILSIKVALNIIKAHPFFGIGINNYTEVMHNYDDTSEQISYITTYGVHNSYFLIASEIGVVGLLFFLCFIILIIKEGIKAIIPQDKFINYVICGAIAGISAFLISISFGPIHLVRSNFVQFWFFSGLIITLIRFVKNDFGKTENEK